MFFQRVPEGKTAKNRMHIDLNVSGGAGVPIEERKAGILAEVARLKSLGASDRRGAMEEVGEFWVRLDEPVQAIGRRWIASGLLIARRSSLR